MAMLLREGRFECRAVAGHKGLLTHFRHAFARHVPQSFVPVRFVVTATTASGYQCESGVVSGLAESGRPPINSIFEFRRRLTENTQQFNVVLLVPTGIGAEIGGHAGDAGPVARLLAGCCDTLITHPNVVNASDINEIPENALYVEGSVLTRLVMGTAGLRRTRSNRVLVVLEDHKEPLFVNAAINSVSAARASYGLRCPLVVRLNPAVRLIPAYTASGSAAGKIEELEGLFGVLDEYRGEYDAVAIATVIHVPESYHMDYFQSRGQMVNPWGGVEAILTHTISGLYKIPSAHSPMLESTAVANADPGVVDPRMAAEAVSTAFLQCTLKGLMRSPLIVTAPEEMSHHAILTASDISCLVIPDGCIGLPTLAALEQGIPVIAVRENKNLMANDLTELPWASDQLYIVENYLEAAGVLAALKAGVSVESVRRPISDTIAVEKNAQRDALEATLEASSNVRTS